MSYKSILDQQYFTYIMLLRLLVEETRVVDETTNYWQLSDQLYQIKLYRVHIAIGGNQSHDMSGDRDWMHR